MPICSRWSQGIKAVAIYRDGSKKAQPLNARAKKEEAARRRDEGEKASQSGCRGSPLQRLPMKLEARIGVMLRLTPAQQAFALASRAHPQGCATEIAKAQVQ